MTRPLNRRGDAYPVSVIIMTAAIVAIVIIASAYIAQALSNSNANLEYQTQAKTNTAVGDIVNSLAFKQFATDGVQMSLKYGDQELFSSLGYTITITYNSTQHLTLTLLPTYNYSYVQTSGYVALSGTNYLNGNGSFFASAGSSLVNIFQWKLGKIVYISTLPRVQYTTQDITFLNGTKVTYLNLNYVRFNTTSLLTHQSFVNVFNFRLQASALSVQTWRIVTGAFNVTASSCPQQFLSCSGSFKDTLSSARVVVVVLSTSTITISKS